MKVVSTFLFAASIMMTTTSAYIIPQPPSSSSKSTTCMSTSNDINKASRQSRRSMLGKSLKTTFLAVSGITLGLSHAAEEVKAERTLGTITESYNRYVPRMVKGFRYLADDVPKLIENGEYETVINEIVAEKGTTISAMKGTMRIFATAFSDSVVTQSTRELQLAALKASNSLDMLATFLKSGDKDGALDAYGQAVYFCQVYSELANSLLPLKTDPIPGPQRTAKRFKEADNSINGAF